MDNSGQVQADWLGANTTSVIIGGLVAILLYFTWKITASRDNEISGPTPLPVFGNFPYIIYKKGIDSAEKIWRQKYGNIFQYYVGQLMQVTVFDLDILKQVLVKDFSLFTNRSYLELTPKPANEGVFFLKGESWKRVRNIMTPTFSGGKLKQMCPDINRCAGLLAANFEKNAGSNKSVEVKSIFGAYTMDVIASTAFGLQVDSQSDPDEPFVKNIGAVFNRKMKLRPHFILSALFPFLVPFFRWMRWSFWPTETLDFFVVTTTAMLKDRKQNQTGRVDFLQLLLNAELDESMIDGAIKPSSMQIKRLTIDEIIGQGFIFFVAGYETTGSLLRYMSYLLATHPDIQDQLYKEIERELGKSEPTYENISKLQFMDQVVNEALRLFPPLGRVTREISETVTINGVTLPKGASLNVPIYEIHHDPLIHSDPEEFKPERFEPELKANMHPAAFLPFGIGPRNCIGMRLALIEAKIALIHILRKVTFVKSSDTEIPLQLNPSRHLVQPVNPIRVQIETRASG